MKKTLIIGLVALFSVALTYGFAYAAVSGVCSGCHTMHASQAGVATTPNDLLLISDCLSCHSSATTSTIVSNTPIVYNTAGYPASARGAGTATTPLAGGNFYAPATTAGDTQVHNVVGILAGADGVLVNTPPGGTALTSQLTCGGTTGCHGVRTEAGNNAAIKGAHHTNVTGTVSGSTLANSFRFLNGVSGVEHATWEQTASSISHNGYKGATDSDGTTVDISYFCAYCHGTFHGATNTGSSTPWSRHPVDIALTADVFAGYGATYLLETPVALATPSTTGAPLVTSRVICMSCHNAHGSPYADMLRFDYSTMNAEDGVNNAGCETCHANAR